MALSLGGATAVISLDIGSFLANIAKANAALGSLGNVRGGGLDALGKGIDDVGKRIDSLRNSKIDLNAGGAVAEAQQVATAVEKVDSAVKEVSGAKLDLNIGDAKEEVKETEESVKSLGDQIEKLDGSFSKVGGGLSVLGGGVTAAFGFAAQASNSFEQAMQNVQSIAKVSTQELDAMGDAVLKISEKTGKGPQDLAEALYDVASSGFEGADALEVLEKSAVAARAGMTDTGTAVKAVSAVLNAYKLDASEAGNVTDVLFKTVDSGVITFEQLAQNLGQVLPLAASLKVSLQELGAAYATLTLAGISPAESETAIAAVMRSAINPTKELTEAVQQYGYASAEALIQAEGFSGFLAVLQEASGGSSAALTDLLGTADATTAVLALLANNGADYTAMLNEMTAATQNGATTQGVLATQMDSTQASLQNASAAFDRFQIAVGKALGPVIRVGADGLTALLNGFTKLPGPVQTAASLLGAFGGVLALTTGAFLLAVPKVVEFISAMKELRQMAAVTAAVSKLQTAMSAMSLVVSPLGIALTAIVAVGALVAKSWYDQKQAADDYNASLKSLDDTLEDIRLNGNDSLADLAQKSIAQFQTLDQYMVDSGEWMKKRAEELIDQGWARPAAGKKAGEEWKALAGDIEISQEKITKSNEMLNKALSDPRVDSTKYIEWRDALIAAALAIEDPIERARALSNALDTINSTPLDKFRKDAEASGEAAEQASTKWEKFFGVIKDGISDVATDLKEKLPDQSFLDKLGTALGADKYDVDAWLAKQQENRDQRSQNMIERLVKAANKSYAFRDLDAGFGAVSHGADTAAAAAERMGAAGRQTVAWMQQAAASANAVAIAFGNGEKALARTAATAEKTASAVEKINEAQKESISQWMEMTNNADFTSQLNLAGLGTSYSNLAEHVNDANTALSDGYRIVVGNTNAIAQNAQQVTDWATDLINAEGTWGKIDDLLANNQITLTEYKDAQAAYNTIAAANADIQEDILTIQAKQAPVLATLMEGTQDYVETLATLPPMQQAVALGWMDANEATKANQALTMAAAAANGELGAQGKKATEAMIQGAVAADPYLKAMLLDMGLISEGADGTITVNFEGAENVSATLDDINTSILTLADLLDNGKLDGSIDIAVKGREEIEAAAAAAEHLAKVGNQTVTITINAAGNAASALTEKDLILSDGSVVKVPVAADVQDWAMSPEEFARQQNTAVDIKGVITDMDTAAEGTLAPVPVTGEVTSIEASPELGDGTGGPTVPVRAQLVFDTGTGAIDNAVNAAMNAISAMKTETKEVTVNVTVNGAELIGALKLDLQNLSNKNVNVTVALSGAELVGVLKLDVQNLSNKTVTITAVVTGAELIGALKLDIQNLSNKTVTVTYSQSGAEAAISIAGGVNQAIDAVPTSVTTTYGQSGAEDMISIAGGVNQAVSAVPESWTTTFSQSGAEDVISIAGGVSQAINAVPSSKTITFSIQTTGSVPKLATGGYVPGVGPAATIARMGERGPELFRTPRGTWGLARTDGLYPMVPGSYVYTAPRTKRMLRNWDGPSFARGGRVPMPTASAQRGTTSVINNEYRVAPNIAIYPQSTLTDREIERVTSEIGDAVAVAVQTKRAAKGGV